ncbi:hypothetical protein PTH_1987 [Pelotomaculum thermopropionicum SI]|uniref:Uncharacterized protein n=1 Tax=Pelotomaculum thermopropionicum (strain DSM 13744 / JCM 10971 / SI) TaxID=370438 RepID=A5D0R2_PELTS|nr:hypothetical protein PTH_1987 [Pelotomaculum thermopropionicum SI]
MYPQTHVYFAENVLGKQGDDVTLGSVLPDMLIGGEFNHHQAHSKGEEIYRFIKKNGSLLDFGKAVVTHGFVPKGLDYYGDEKYLDFEKGYCFEKARPFILKTVEACNIPAEMGWWKAHNIIEMGVELLISSSGDYSERIKSAFANRLLVSGVDEMFRSLWKEKELNFISRVKRFAGFIEMGKATAVSLARKYRLQMLFKHQVEIDTKKVARLIYSAAESVNDDLQKFFDIVSMQVKENIGAVL